MLLGQAVEHHAERAAAGLELTSPAERGGHRDHGARRAAPRCRRDSGNRRSAAPYQRAASAGVREALARGLDEHGHGVGVAERRGALDMRRLRGRPARARQAASAEARRARGRASCWRPARRPSHARSGGERQRLPGDRAGCTSVKRSSSSSRSSASAAPMSGGAGGKQPLERIAGDRGTLQQHERGCRERRQLAGERGANGLGTSDASARTGSPGGDRRSSDRARAAARRTGCRRSRDRAGRVRSARDRGCRAGHAPPPGSAA